MRKRDNSLVGLIIFFAFGLILGYAYGAAKAQDSKDYAQKLQVLEKKIEEAQKLLPSMEELYSISGTIQEIRPSDFTIAVTFPLNPFDETPKIRKIIITNSTKIAEQKAKDYGAYQKELQEYRQKSSLQENDETQQDLPPIPMAFGEKILSLSDLSVGDSVSVSSNRDIKMSEEFEVLMVIRQTFEKIPVQTQIPIQSQEIQWENQ